MTLSSLAAVTVSAFGGGSGFSIWGFTRFFSSTSVSLRRRTNSIFGGAWISSSAPLLLINVRSSQNSATEKHQAATNASGSRRPVKPSRQIGQTTVRLMVDWVRVAGEVRAGRGPPRACSRRRRSSGSRPGSAGQDRCTRTTPEFARLVDAAFDAAAMRGTRQMKLKIDRFDMERTQCLYEHEVRFNLSESGVLPLSLGELVPDRSGRAELDSLRLRSPHSTGRRELRANIARFYGGADPESVMVTNGGSEANYTALWGLAEKRERVAFMLPNYLQGWGLARAWGKRADGFALALDRDASGG